MNSSIVSALYISVLKKEGKNDILDLILPFVIATIAEEAILGQPLSISDLQKRLGEDYDLEDLPAAVIKSLLRRLCKKGILKREGGEHYLYKIYNADNQKKDMQSYLREFSRDFTERLIKNRESSEKVIIKLGDHLGVNPEKKKGFLETSLLAFFEHSGHDIVNDIGRLKYNGITDQRLFNVGQFVLKEHEKKSSTYLLILQMLEGFMLKKIVYFQDEVINEKSKLNNLNIYLDTIIILRALGLKTNEENKSAMAMMKLAKELKAKPFCFEHNFDEVYGIISNYLKNRHRFQTQTLEAFDYKKVDDESIETYLASLRSEIENKGISIVDNETFEDKSIDYDESELTRHLKSIGYSKEEALQNDIKSITSIRRSRGKIGGKSKLTTIEGCKAIFVTGNANLVKETKEFFVNKDTYEGKRMVPVIMTDVELTTILWIKSSNSRDDLPELKLLQNARTAVNPSPRSMEEVKKKLELFESLTPESKGLLERSMLDNYAYSEIFEQTSASGKSTDEFLEKEYLKIKDAKSKNKQLTSENKRLHDEKDNLERERDKERQIRTNLREQFLEKIRNKSDKASQRKALLLVSVSFIFLSLAVGTGTYWLSNQLLNFGYLAGVAFFVLDYVHGVILDQSLTSRYYRWIEGRFKKKIYNKHLHKLKSEQPKLFI